ncbi:hypothetical protein VL10_20655 [Leclercia adecarboxylata]|nr:hypothetical protein VL10_20655 [Leclercia adecarboxylata]KMN64134.1 hypothetical protein VK95_16620 [Leclercia sp. LK8]
MKIFKRTTHKIEAHKTASNQNSKNKFKETVINLVSDIKSILFCKHSKKPGLPKNEFPHLLPPKTHEPFQINSENFPHTPRVLIVRNSLKETKIVKMLKPQREEFMHDSHSQINNDCNIYSKKATGTGPTQKKHTDIIHNDVAKRLSEQVRDKAIHMKHDKIHYLGMSVTESNYHYNQMSFQVPQEEYGTEKLMWEKNKQSIIPPTLLNELVSRRERLHPLREQRITTE